MSLFKPIVSHKLIRLICEQFLKVYDIACHATGPRYILVNLNQTIVKAMLWKKEVWQMLTWEYFIYTAREAWHVIGEFIVVSDVLLYGYLVTLYIEYI